MVLASVLSYTRRLSRPASHRRRNLREGCSEPFEPAEDGAAIVDEPRSVSRVPGHLITTAAANPAANPPPGGPPPCASRAAPFPPGPPPTAPRPPASACGPSG